MNIKHATMADLEGIMQLIEEGRKKMIAQGNLHQWTKGHPSRELIENDIRRQCSYVMTVEDENNPLSSHQGERMVATFALVQGPDPTYAEIYEGAWLNDRPYYVIHRVASAPGVRGVMRAILDYAFAKTDTIRVDTHADNLTMQNLLRKYGFEYCGVIHLANGDPRLAFQKTGQL